MKLLGRSSFFKAVSLLVGGTAFAQVVTIVILPLVTRLYSPAEFEVLAVFSAALAIVSVIACLRFELAIPLPVDDEEAINLLGLAFLVCCIVSALTAVVLFCFSEKIAHLSTQFSAGKPFLYLLPIGVFLSGAYSSFQFWATRKKSFSLVAKTRISQSLLAASTQVGLGFFPVVSGGLLFSHLINSGAGVFGLALSAFRTDLRAITQLSFIRMRQVARKYRDFPRYSAIEALANILSMQLPIIIIAAKTIGPEAGYLALASRVMAAPMSLVGGAIAQVYISHAPAEFREGNLSNFTVKIIGNLAKIGVGPLIFAGIVAPTIFPIIFGPRWVSAGYFVSWMTPWFVLQFLSSPVAMTLHVTGNQRIALTLQIVGVIIRVGAVLLACQYTPSYLVEVFSASGFVFYTIYLFVVISVARIGVGDLLRALSRCWKFVAPWVLFAGGVLIFRPLATGA